MAFKTFTWWQDGKPTHLTYGLFLADPESYGPEAKMYATARQQIDINLLRRLGYKLVDGVVTKLEPGDGPDASEDPTELDHDPTTRPLETD